MKWYKLVLLGFGIGWVLGICTLYLIYSVNLSDKGGLQDRVDIYISDSDVNSLIDVLYQNGVIQDKESFRRFLAEHSDIQTHLVNKKRITFKKAMSYEEILDIIMKTN